MAKSWRERMQGGKPAHVEILEKPFGSGMPSSRMLVADPRVVDAVIRATRPGALSTIAELRSELAAQHVADICCPISTSIFVRICAEAALAELEMGRSVQEVTPFWRVVEPNGTLAKKLSCGTDFVTRMRSAESCGTAKS